MVTSVTQLKPACRIFMLLIVLLAILIALPIFGVVATWANLDAGGLEVLRQQFDTVLPSYLATSGIMALIVPIGVVVIGAVCAVTVSLFEFKGRRFLSWALLLPMAMPAYVSAYAYTDFFQYSGLVQTTIREVFPEFRMNVRSIYGAVCMFIVTLYPYTYLLARSALSERGVHLMEAARLMGASLTERIWRVALPLARPALTAGAALALMETLADFGVGSYFGLQTLTTGIYKAWTVMDNHIAAAQYASVLLFFVAVLLWLERKEQKRMRFATTRGQRDDGAESRLPKLHGKKMLLAWSICLLPVIFGFLLPVGILCHLMLREAVVIDWSRYMQWAWNSFRFGGIAAFLAVALSVCLSFAQRTNAMPTARHRFVQFVARLASMGYAIPGSVIAVGILVPVAFLQACFPESRVGIILTGSAVGIIYAYLVRFTAVAVQSVESGYTRIPHTIDEAARILATPRWQIVTKLHLPLLWRSLMIAALMVFVDVVKELPATLLLRPFDSDTLAVIAHNLARDERLAEASLPSLSIVIVGLIPVILVTRALNKRT
jgi:iron(III) transport system permease protein